MKPFHLMSVAGCLAGACLLAPGCSGDDDAGVSAGGSSALDGGGTSGGGSSAKDAASERFGDTDGGGGNGGSGGGGSGGGGGTDGAGGGTGGSAGTGGTGGSGGAAGAGGTGGTGGASGGDGTGAFVATLYQGTTDFFFGGTVSPYAWITSRDYVTCDFVAAIDVAPGVGNAWTLKAEYATLAPGQSCADITSWTTKDLCTLARTTKACEVKGLAVDIVGPACLRGHATISGTPTARGGGTASFHCYDGTSDGPVHFQGTGQATVDGSFALFGGNVIRGTNMDRAYFLATGTPLKSCGGVMALPSAPGAGKTWHIQIASSQTALTPGQNCLDLAYNKTGDLCTISGATQKECHFAPAALDVPEGGCLQLQGTCTGGCAMGTMAPNYGLDCSTSGASPYNAGGPTYENAGSGAFDANHSFDLGPWAISDRKPDISVPVLGQQYWRAPMSGLKGCSGAFTFAVATGGSGQYDIGLRTSTTAPTAGQGCLDLAYTDSATLCSMKVGEKSCRFSLASLPILPNACFALMVKSSQGTPSNGSAFNWQASCVD